MIVSGNESIIQTGRDTHQWLGWVWRQKRDDTTIEGRVRVDRTSRGGRHRKTIPGYKFEACILPKYPLLGPRFPHPSQQVIQAVVLFILQGLGAGPGLQVLEYGREWGGGLHPTNLPSIPHSPCPFDIQDSKAVTFHYLHFHRFSSSETIWV